MTGRLEQRGFRAAGAAALIPSFAREGSGSSDRSFKAIYPGHAALAQVNPCRNVRNPLFRSELYTIRALSSVPVIVWK